MLAVEQPLGDLTPEAVAASTPHVSWRQIVDELRLPAELLD
jgi:hypothetical protein